MTQSSRVGTMSPDSNAKPCSSMPRAATYARMSTLLLNFSIELQREKLTAYAAEHAFQIVQAYADEGKSGLRLAGRHGL